MPMALIYYNRFPGMYNIGMPSAGKSGSHGAGSGFGLAQGGRGRTSAPSHSSDSICDLPWMVVAVFKRLNTGFFDHPWLV